MSVAAAELRRARLEKGLRILGLPLPDTAIGTLLDYLDLLQKWNRVYNLTAVRDVDAMVTHHVLDSLSVLPWIRGARILDVGSGAGLPGIPIAVAQPDATVTLLEAVEKKTAFLQQAIGQLGLRNARVVRARAEEWHPEERFDTVVARAVADLSELFGLTRHLIGNGGRLVAMKGAYPAAELAALPPRAKVVATGSVSVPDLNAARHVVVIASDGQA